MSIPAEERQGPLSAPSARQTSSAVYTRTACPNQLSSAARDQFKSCASEALNRGLAVVHVYSDTGYSGMSDITPPGLTALMTAAARGEISTVIVSDGDRISRNAATFAMVHDVLAEAGVTLISVTEGRLNTRYRAEEVVLPMTGDPGRYRHVNGRGPATSTIRGAARG